MTICAKCGGDETFGEMTSGYVGATGIGSALRPTTIHMHRSESSCSAAKTKRISSLEARVTELEGKLDVALQSLDSRLYLLETRR